MVKQVRSKENLQTDYRLSRRRPKQEVKVEKASTRGGICNPRTCAEDNAQPEGLLPLKPLEKR